MKVDVLDISGKVMDTVDLDDRIFAVNFNMATIKKVIDWQLAGRRSGNHSTKNISAISGTTAKPYRQKGTGRARQGSLRSPQFRGGATVFGPVVRSHSYSLNKKIRRAALRSALSYKLSDGNLMVLNSISLPTHKTRDFISSVSSGLRGKSMLMVDSTVERNTVLATRNLSLVNVVNVAGVNVYDLMKHSVVLITLESLKGLEHRLL